MNWEDFVNEHERPIYGFCMQYLGNIADAEDATQDVFMRYFQEFKSGKEMHRGWLYTVARNVCIDRKRWFNRFAAFLKGLPVERASSANDAMQNIYVILQTLSKQQREVFILRHWHGFSTVETARIVGVSEGSIKTHLKRAVDKIKRGLRDED